MSRSLPERPNLEQLRKQAKNLLKAQKKGDASVCSVLRHLSRFAGSSDEEILKARLRLSEAQHALALTYGFKSWAALMRCVRTGPWPRQAGRISPHPTFQLVSVALSREPKPAPNFMPTVSVETGGRCRLCDTPATVHVTDRSEGRVVEWHYCDKHAEENVFVSVGSRNMRMARNIHYPVKYTVTVSLTQEELDRHEAIPVTLPDGSAVQIRFPWDAVDGRAIIAGPKPGEAEMYCVRFLLKVVPPPAER